jgi:hypothetical protein
VKILYDVTQSEVWNHWKKIENFTDDNFRTDIRDPLPNDLTWHIAEVEWQDFDRMFIISSGDWTDISGGTFRLAEVASRFDLPTADNHTKRISDDIRRKIKYLKSGGQLDSRLIAVTNSSKLDGPITFIEGNRRSVTFAVCQKLVGLNIYVGVSPKINDYPWAKASFRYKI